MSRSTQEQAAANAKAREEAYLELRRAYRDVFGSPQGRAVLADLARYCRQHKTTLLTDDPSGRNSAALEGKRQVALYVNAMSSETDDLLRVMLEDDIRAQSNQRKPQ